MTFECPDKNELLNFASGRLPQDRLEQLASHIEQCGRCLAILEEESVTPTWKEWISSSYLSFRADAQHRDALHNARQSEEVEQVELPQGYILLEELGRGGMGVVYRVRDERIGRDVAMKVMRAEAAADRRATQRFLSEACITGQLQHPGIPPVYEVGRLADERPYFVMKLVKGQTLHSLLHARRDVNEERGRFLAIFDNLCQAVSYAHDRKVIHRDLKPGNVMVGAFGEVQVMDWGLAKLLPDSEQPVSQDDLPLADTHLALTSIDTPFQDGWRTRTGSAMGTVPFMAPEQAGGEVALIGTHTDVFGLGAVLCVILTGEPPYRGHSSHELRLKAVRADLTDAYQRLDNCGAEPELVMLAKRCLAANAQERFRTAGDVAQAVAAFRQQAEERAREAEKARAAAEVRAEEQRMRRLVWRVAAGLLFIATVVMGALAIWATHQGRRAHQAQQLATKRLEEAVVQRQRAQSALQAEQIARQEAVAAQERTERHRREALANLSVYQADRGSRALQAGDAHGLLDVLEACHTVREFPTLAARPGALWTLWHAALRNTLAAQMIHEGDARAAVFLSDRLIASGGNGGLIRVWDSTTGQQVASPLLCLPMCTALAASPDGRRLAAAVWESNEVRLWHVRGWQPSPVVLRHNDSITALAWSPDNRHLLSGSDDGTAMLWNVDTGVAVLPPIRLDGWVRTVSVSTDGKWLAAGSYEGVLAIRSSRRADAPVVKRTFSGAINAVAFVDNQTLVVGCEDGVVELVSVDGANTLQRLPQQDRVEAIAVAPDGSELAIAVRQVVQRWHLPEGSPIGFPLQHIEGLSHMQYAADGGRLVTAGFDGIARVWRLQPFPPTPIRQLDYPEECWSLAWQADGTSVLFGTQQGHVLRWTWQNQRVEPLLAEQPNAVLSLAVSPGGQYVATASSSESGKDIRLLPGVVQLWNAVTGDRHGEAIVFGRLSWGTAFSDDGKWFAAVSWAHDARVYRLPDMKQQFRFTQHGGPPMSVAFNHAGTQIAVGTGVGSVSLWSLKDGRSSGSALNEAQAVVQALAFSPDDQLLAAASWLKGVFLWDVARRRLAVPPLPHPGRVFTVAFHPAGHWLASGGEDGSVRLWEPTTGLLAGPVLEAGGKVHAVAFSPDGRHLAAAVSVEKTANQPSRGKVFLWSLPDIPQDIRSMEAATWNTLGVRRNDSGSLTPTPLMPAQPTGP